MSIEIMAEVWKHAPCRGGELLFVLALADQAGDEDRCAWPGMKMLMERTRSSRRSVYNYADTLQRQQVIEQIAPEDAPKRWRPARHGGHETTLWRIRPVDEWLDEDGVLLIRSSTGAEVAPQETSTSTGRGATSAHMGCNPLHQNQQEPPTRKNNYPTTSGSRPSRRASARRSDDGWADPARDAVDEVGEPNTDDDFDRPTRRHGHDSAWALNRYYRQEVSRYAQGVLGDTNDKAMMKFFAEAKRREVSPDTLRRMVDIFVEDDRLFAKAIGARWRVFIANAEVLRRKAVEQIQSETRWADKDAEQFGGSIPQHILDKVLAEAG